MTALDIELACAEYFGILPQHGGMGNNRNMLIPNFKALFCHECDLLVVTSSNWAYEIEIKVSVSDLRNDKKKDHQHINGKIGRLYFAIPETMKDSIDLIPEHAGILLVGDDGRCREHRKARRDKRSRKLTDKEVLHCVRVAAMRIWMLKKKLAKMRN